MEKRSSTLRFSLGIPCEIGKFNRKTDNWEYTEGVIHTVDGNYLILDTQQKLELDESIRLNLLNERWHSFDKGDKKPVRASGRDPYIDAHVVQFWSPTIDEKSGYCVKVSNRSFTGKYYNQGKIDDRRTEERRKGERRITGAEISELIELASEIGMDNVVYRSGYYAPKSTRQPSAERRELFDRRVLIP